MIKNISPHFYAFILTLLQDAFTLNFDFHLIIQVFRSKLRIICSKQEPSIELTPF